MLDLYVGDLKKVFNSKAEETDAILFFITNDFYFKNI